METAPNKSAVLQKEIVFANGNHALMVAPPAGTPASDILRALNLPPPKLLLFIIGAAAPIDDVQRSRLLQLFSRGIAPAASESGALILDEGTDTGAIPALGQGVADRGRKTILLGVVPSGQASFPGGPSLDALTAGALLEPNHSHFVLASGKEWGDERTTICDLSVALAAGIPVVTVLVGGGPVTKVELLHSVRQRWPVIVIEGSGTLADEVARLHQGKSAFIEDAAMSEIVADGDFHFFPIASPPEGMVRLITRTAVQDHHALQQAWERFALYDANAGRQQTSFARRQLQVLILGGLGTLLALTQKEWQLDPVTRPGLPAVLLHWVIVLIPITISILIAAGNRFKEGNKWLLLRSCAEGIKREIFRYRARADGYNHEDARRTPRDVRLARKVENISRQLMQTEVNVSALRPPPGPVPPKTSLAADDDGFSLLTPDRYLAVRLDDQIHYYRKKTARLESQWQRLQWGLYVVGGLGTFLAAIGAELWIALTGTIAAAFSTFLEYRQVENSLLKYNQGLTNLENLKSWWDALPAIEQARPERVDALVKHTEVILQGELTGWVQQMKDALADLHDQQSGPKPDGAAPAKDPPGDPAATPAPAIRETETTFSRRTD
jgi:hypothetical protein